MTLVWEQGDAYFLKTQCGRFTISKSWHPDLVYTLWQRPSTILATARVPDSTNRQACKSAVDGLKDLCEGHIKVSGSA